MNVLYNLYRSCSYLEIRQLSKGLRADVTFILNLSILLLQWVREGFVAWSVP